MIVALIVLGLTVVALLVMLSRQAARHDHAVAAHRLQVAGLLQRIQAPEIAVAEHAGRNHSEDEGAVSMFDDAAFWKSIEDHG